MRVINGRIRNIFNRVIHNDFWRKLFKNSFLAFIGDSVASVVNLVVVILIIRMIGNLGYGYLVLAQTYTLIVDALINIQSWKSIIQFGQKAIVNNDVSRLHGYVKLGTVLDISTAIAGAVISALLVPLVSAFFSWETEVTNCCYILSCVILFHFSGTPTGVLRILNQFAYTAWQKIISVVFKCLMLGFFCFCWKNISLLHMAVVYAFTDILGHMLLTIFAMHVYNKKYGIKNMICSKLPKDSKKFVQFTIWTTLSDVVDIPVNYFDVMVVSFLSVEMTAIFKVFKQIVSILSKVSTPIYQAILPQFSELSAQGNLHQGYQVVKKMHHMILLIMIPFSLLLGISSKLWLIPFFGIEYSHYWYVLTFYLIAQSIALSYSTIHPYFVSLGRVKESAYYVLFANLIYILFVVLIIKRYGMLGMILGYILQFSTVILLKKKKIRSILAKEKLYAK